MNLAIDYLKHGLSLAEKMNSEMGVALSLILLGMVYLQLDDLKEVQKYLNLFKSSTNENLNGC